MEELLGRRVPYSAEAERAVIGAMLISPACIPDVLEKLTAGEFYIDENREIYETISSMFSFGLSIDPVTLLDRMKTGGVIRDNSGNYLAEVISRTPTAANVLEYAAIVRDRALLRKLGETAEEINKLVYESSGEAESVLDAAEKMIYALRSRKGVGGLIHISDVMQNVFDILNAAAESGRKIPGISTGLSTLDDMILGLNKSELILIAARPGMGKTSIALNMAMHAAMNEKKNVAMFSLEMSREQLVTRLLSGASLVPSKNLQTGDISTQQWRDVTAAAQVLNDMEMRIDDNPTLTVSDMNAQCRRIKNLDLVVIDYLQLMQSAGSGHSWSNESRTQAVSDISRMLKIMAKELQIPVVCLSQLSRANESRNDKRPQLSDLRESGAIEQDADVVIGLYREGYYNSECENPYLTEAIILKNRKGSTGKVNLNWNPETTSFSCIDTIHDE